jgi:hypothetical protein
MKSFLFEAANDDPTSFESAGYNGEIDHSNNQQTFPSNGLHLNQRMNNLQNQIISLNNQMSIDKLTKKNDNIFDPSFMNTQPLMSHPNLGFHDQMPSGSFEHDFEDGFHEVPCKGCEEKPPKVIVKKIKIKQKPKVVYKIKKIYIPKPIPIVKKVKVIKKVPVKKIVYKTKIKKVGIVTDCVVSSTKARYFLDHRYPS